VKIVFRIAYLIIVICFLARCIDDNEDQLTPNVLQGTWIEKEPDDIIQFAGNNYTFSFKQDTFFMKKKYWTDIVVPGNSNSSIIYAKGLYTIETDTIRLFGNLCPDSSYCNHAATMYLKTYSPKFEYELISNTELIFNSSANDKYFQIRLVKVKQ
jgi:hypothetical protein